MNFNEKLAVLRKERAISQEELSQEIGVTRQVVYRWEKGLVMPSVENLISLSDFFEVNIDTLVKNDYEISNDKPIISEPKLASQDETQVEKVSAGDVSAEPVKIRVNHKRFIVLLLILIVLFITVVNVGAILGEQNTAFISMSGLYAVVPLYILFLYLVIWAIEVIKHRIKGLRRQKEDIREHEKDD